MRRSTIVVGAVAIVGAATATGFVVAAGRGDDAAAETAVDSSAANVSYSPVTRQDLVRNEELNGTTGYGEPTPLVLKLEGTLTALPEPGQEIRQGDVIAEINGEPVIAANGTVPLWRDLDGSVADGADVLQVEQMLAELGYAAEFDVTVDEDWTSATTDAVEAFQEVHGQEDDGKIALGELVFIDGTVRVAAVSGVVGQATADAGIEVTSVNPVVSVELDGDDSDLVAAGDAVTVELPDGTQLPATVSNIGTAETDEEGSTTIPVEVTIDDPSAADIANGTPVDVLVGIVSAENVLTVPVEALLAIAEGGYAVEVKGGATGTHLVGVDTGAFADGRVEITGTTEAITEGQEVVVPT